MKVGDRVIYTPSAERGAVKKTAPRYAIVEFDHTPGKHFQVSLDKLEKENEPGRQGSE